MRSTAAQRRPALPGRQPFPAFRACTASFSRSTKAGPSGPATLMGCSCVVVAMRTLNEGRPFRAGNPLDSRRFGVVAADAQRRPALPGRQPSRSAVRMAPKMHAQRRPALPGRQPRRTGSRARTSAGSAQRRPALPGRQPDLWALDSLDAEVNAQRRPALPGRQPPTSATPPTPMGRSLNEGRPFRAGNPPRVGNRPLPSCSAQRRPALPGRQPLMTRETFEEAFDGAQRRPALPGRQPLAADPDGEPFTVRSTKAGPSGPATLRPVGDK